MTVISTSPSKEKEARETLGADNFVVSKSVEAMAAAAQTLDGIIDTVSAPHDLGELLKLIKVWRARMLEWGEGKTRSEVCGDKWAGSPVG